MEDKSALGGVIETEGAVVDLYIGPGAAFSGIQEAANLGIGQPESALAGQTIADQFQTHARLVAQHLVQGGMFQFQTGLQMDEQMVVQIFAHARQMMRRFDAHVFEFGAVANARLQQHLGGSRPHWPRE